MTMSDHMLFGESSREWLAIKKEADKKGLSLQQVASIIRNDKYQAECLAMDNRRLVMKLELIQDLLNER